MKKISIFILLPIILLGATCYSPQPTKPTANQNTNSVSANLNTSSANPACQSPTPVQIPAGNVLSLSKTAEPQSYAFATQHGAEIIPVDQNKSFSVWWQPADFNPASDIVVVSLGGHAGWATKDFQVWYPEVSQHQYAYLGIQWWFGRSLEDHGYYDPAHIYAAIQEVLTSKGIPAGHVIFQGFSMGSARSYGVSMYDNLCGQHWFGANIANAGFWESDYPLYADVLSGKFGTEVFKNTHWILFCAGNDKDVKTSCQSMQNTTQVITQYGGTVDLSFEDPTGDHGSFMINSANVEKALETATVLVKGVDN